MEKLEQLKEIIARYWQISDGDLDWNTPFDSQSLPNFSSLRMLRFLASVEERFQMQLADVEAIRSFQDLRQWVENS